MFIGPALEPVVVVGIEERCSWRKTKLLKIKTTPSTKKIRLFKRMKRLSKKNEEALTRVKQILMASGKSKQESKDILEGNESKEINHAPNMRR